MITRSILFYCCILVNLRITYRWYNTSRMQGIVRQANTHIHIHVCACSYVHANTQLHDISTQSHKATYMNMRIHIIYPNIIQPYIYTHLSTCRYIIICAYMHAHTCFNLILLPKIVRIIYNSNEKYCTKSNQFKMPQA